MKRFDMEVVLVNDEDGVEPDDGGQAKRQFKTSATAENEFQARRQVLERAWATDTRVVKFLSIVERKEKSDA